MKTAMIHLVDNLRSLPTIFSIKRYARNEVKIADDLAGYGITISEWNACHKRALELRTA